MANQTISHEFNWAELLRSAVKDSGIISKAYSVFHNYSIGNQILATMQCIIQGIPVAPINTYKGWKKLNRQVKKGSKAIQLCMPVIYKYKEADEQTGEENPVSTRHCSKLKRYLKWGSKWGMVASGVMELRDGRTTEN